MNTIKMEGSSDQPMGRGDRLNQLYLAIISRYKDYIGEKENLSVAELPTLVIPGNIKVKEKAEEIKSEFLNYTYEADFSKAASTALDFINKEISDVILPLQFWLTPNETLTFMLGDAMDRSILLCSILVSLGNPSSKVLVMMLENKRSVVVYYEFNGRTYVLDASGTKEFGSKDEMLKSFEFKDDTIVYEFNNQMYADII